ncbi:hypothetical protein KP509_06G004300 [Ceratopteris richardii]|nr:hypothetical protein KP509_06G004300 [Ceratopteris richardii]
MEANALILIDRGEYSRCYAAKGLGKSFQRIPVSVMVQSWDLCLCAVAQSLRRPCSTTYTCRKNSMAVNTFATHRRLDCTHLGSKPVAKQAICMEWPITVERDDLTFILLICVVLQHLNRIS